MVDGTAKSNNEMSQFSVYEEPPIAGHGNDVLKSESVPPSRPSVSKPICAKTTAFLSRLRLIAPKPCGAELPMSSLRPLLPKPQISNKVSLPAIADSPEYGPRKCRVELPNGKIKILEFQKIPLSMSNQAFCKIVQNYLKAKPAVK